MPRALRSRQLTPSKSGTKPPDSSQDLSMSQQNRRRSARLSASKEKEKEVEVKEEQQDYVSDSLDEDTDDEPTPRKKLKLGADDHKGKAIADDDKGNAIADDDKGKAIADDDKGKTTADDDKGKAIAEASDKEEVIENIALLATRFSRQEKGKGIVINDASVGLDLNLGLAVPGALNPVPPQVVVNPAPAAIPVNNNEYGVESRASISKKIAKENASRFARANSFDRVEEEADPDPDPDPEPKPADKGAEDWPGPFSTAMKIIRDRKSKGSGKEQHFGLDSAGAPTVIWKPNRDGVKDSSVERKRIAPSLQDLCMQVLVKNYEAITSLEFIPDAMRHKLVSMLCDTRKLTVDVLNLVFQGSPSEICITDCSWIEEEQFKASFETCNTENLVVLQLNLCGRCMPDYVVQETLAIKGLPALTTLSLKGACRLSDDGLKALISSAPAINSLNLSQCSLITNAGVNTMADSLRSGLRELYLDDCQTLNAMVILPALQRLENLEVLSLAGIPSVSDKFLKQLIGSIGRNIKELALANCIKLTDNTLKEISKHCFKLCVLDLVNVTKLTDSGLGYLANCCQAIQSLKLSGNPFSDEAVAALLEACGENLKELSLNNISKIGPHTTISIARRCKNLVELDVSWCRNLTDECLGLIADSCESLQMLKVFGCTQITSTFLAGHSNEQLLVIGIQLTPILENPKKQDQLLGPLRYSAL